MSATDTDSYYCEICNEQFDIHSLYACFQGHFFCKSCFKQEYYKGKEKRCPHLTCNAWIDNTHVPRSHGEPARISNKMFPQPVLYSQDKTASSDTDVTKPFISNSSLTSTSKNSDSLKSSPVTPQPILVAMASKVSLVHNEDNFGNQSLHDEKEYCNCECFPPTEKMIVWIASNITTKFSYTLALSTEFSPIRLKYYGPLLSINEDHEKLCLEGKGLILNKHQIMNLTDNGTKSMSLDILIHYVEDGSNNQKTL